MHKTVVIDTVALTERMIDSEVTPNLFAFLNHGKSATIIPAMPAVTCSAQTAFITGQTAAIHGVVGNGWYERGECEIKFWRQSNKLVTAPKVWDEARLRNQNFTCANLFWWFNMYSSVDYSVTPRPNYLANGRKLPDVYTVPAYLRDELQQKLGQFPLFNFWGPGANIISTQWIAESARLTVDRFNPTLTLIYLPHLDYALQKFVPDSTEAKIALREIDAVCGELINYFQKRDARIVILSEYGIMPVDTPVHINRLLRERGFLAIRQERGREILDAGASAAFAVADHQIAHVYVNDKSKLSEVAELLKNLSAVAEVWGESEKRGHGLNHVRAGDLVAVAAPNSWFTYYYWKDESLAPDFARTVEIHRKPGYDPLELFIDPTLKFPKVQIAWKAIRQKLGLRTLFDFIPLDANLLRGSHGRLSDNKEDYPVCMTNASGLLLDSQIKATDVYELILRHIFN